MTLALTIVQVVIALAIIATVLLQSGTSAGLSGSIAGGAETFFGKKKGMDEFLSRTTRLLAAVFFAITVIIAIIE